MANCCQNSNLASILFDGKKNTFLNFLIFFQKVKKRRGSLLPVLLSVLLSRLQKFLAFQHTKNDVALFNIEKTKICKGEIAQLPLLLVQRKVLKFKRCNASRFAIRLAWTITYARQQDIIDSWMRFSIHLQLMLPLQKKNHSGKSIQLPYPAHLQIFLNYFAPNQSPILNP